MPESVRDRPTKAHEYLFLLTKSERYYYDQEAVREASQASEATKTREAYGRYDAGDGTAKRNTRTGKPDYLQAIGNDYGGSSRNLRSVWTIATAPFPDAHFPTFPPKLIEPCIKAGTSEKGCCPQCGAPWIRIRKRRTDSEPMGKGEWEEEAAEKGQVGIRGRRRVALDRKTAEEKNPGYLTLRWEPSCKCTECEPIPCRVLDPFGGAGTTGLVAQKFGQNYTLIELNPKYAEMSERRIEKAIRDEAEKYRNTVFV